MNLSHRTFFGYAAENAAETGLETALWSFNDMADYTIVSNPTRVAQSWNGTRAGAGGTVWTIGNTVASVFIESSGSGYSSAPTVTFSGGGGTGAAGTAVLTSIDIVSGGSIVTITGVGAINITNPGSGYTSPPTINFTGGGGSGAAAQVRMSAKHTIAITGLEQNATGQVNVWVDGYDGTAVVPKIVAKATIRPTSGRPITKYIEVILSKTNSSSKGVVTKNGFDWNGHPTADSYASSAVPGVPPFVQYDSATHTSLTTLASITGSIALSHGTVNGSVLTGPGATVSTSGGNSPTITGSTIPNFAYNFGMPVYPEYSAGVGQYNLGTVAALDSVLPRPLRTIAGTTYPADVPSADGSYYYFVDGTTIGSTTISAGANVVIVGTGNTKLQSGFNIAPTAAGVPCGSATIYMDGNVALSGNDEINNLTWPGALHVYTTTTADCTFGGNASFSGVLTAPNSELIGNGSGSQMADLSGSFVVKYMRSNGHMNVHWDSNLNTSTSPKVWAVSLWRELQSQQDRALYDTQLTF